MALHSGKTVVLTRGNVNEVILIRDGADAAKATMRVAQWLNRCLFIAEETRACVSFGVGIHGSGSECDHPIQFKASS